MQLVCSSASRAAVCLLVVSCLLQTLASAAGPSSDDALKRRQSTINGLVVRQLPDGKFTGLAIGIVATATGDEDGGKVVIRGTIGDQMRSALDEAEKYVRVNAPKLGNARVEISFAERYSPKDGGSAGTAFAVLLRSLVEGYAIDGTVGITGDIAVNGTVQPIGGVNAKLKGARADGCTICVVPKGNVPAIADQIVLGADKLDLLRTMQVFAATTVDDAVAIARADRDAAHAEAVKLYAQAMQDMAAGPASLRKPEVQAKLRRVLELAPNHVTAQFALDIGVGKGPATLTRYGSVASIFQAAAPFWEVQVRTKGDFTREDLPKATVVEMKRNLALLARTTHPDTENLRRAMNDWIDTVDKLLISNGRRLSAREREAYKKRYDSLIAELRRLDTDEALVEKMMREGY
jgi:hypothetical protein